MKMPLIITAAMAVGICLMITTGCGPEAKEAKGFRLPPGDVEKGKAAFVALSCQTCHTVTGVELPPAPSPGQHNVVLGGEVVKVKTYGELVTAIIHPAHDIAVSFDASKVEGTLSPMPEYNHVMTVDQLIDVTEFLHSRYKLRQVDYLYDYSL